VSQPSWDAVADVVVVGFGAAGACAAIEAADGGADVLVLDRFTGGGATNISGGIVYAGGGTRHQRAAGVEDSVEQMLAYLRLETAGAVTDETLRSFCEGSVEMLGWLESHGVPFEGSLAPYKTSYPTNRYYLYYSGNELSGPARAVATPAQRGHRAKGRGTSGRAVFGPLRRAVEQRRVRVQALTRAEELVTDESGTVVGVVCSTVEGAPRNVVRRYRWMARRVAKLNLWYRPAGKELSRRLERIERRYGRRWTVRARRGVVLSSGGFAFNRDMMREHAAPYLPGLPLGTLGDDGSGIRMGQAAGGATRYLDRASAWRFYTPPSALAKGVLLGPDGERVCNEALYGAAVAEAVIHQHGGQAHLLVDRRILREARKQVPHQTLWFQRLQTLTMFGSGRAEGATVAEVAAKVGIDPAAAERTVAAYNAALLADRRLGALVGRLPVPHDDARGPGRRRAHRAGAPGGRQRGSRSVRRRAHRRGHLLQLLRERPLPRRLRVLRPPGRPFPQPDPHTGRVPGHDRPGGSRRCCPMRSGARRRHCSPTPRPSGSRSARSRRPSRPWTSSTPTRSSWSTSGSGWRQAPPCWATRSASRPRPCSR
jgi:3-oxo-5alpha-steroid 4-dehydrogenase